MVWNFVTRKWLLDDTHTNAMNRLKKQENRLTPEELESQVEEQLLAQAGRVVAGTYAEGLAEVAGGVSYTAYEKARRESDFYCDSDAHFLRLAYVSWDCRLGYTVHTLTLVSVGCSVDSLICLKPSIAIASDVRRQRRHHNETAPRAHAVDELSGDLAEPTEPPIEFIAPIQAIPSVKRVGGTRCSISWLPFTHVGAWQTPMHRWIDHDHP